MLITVKTKTGGSMINRLSHGRKDLSLLVGASGFSAFMVLVFIGYTFLFLGGVHLGGAKRLHALFDSQPPRVVSEAN